MTITSSGNITTQGGFAHGIAVVEAIGYKLVQITTHGTIKTGDSGSAGISVANSLADVDIIAQGSIYTDNEASHGIQVQDTSGKISVTTSGGLIRIGGPSSRGIYVINTHGDVSVEAGGEINTYEKS